MGRHLLVVITTIHKTTSVIRIEAIIYQKKTGSYILTKKQRWELGLQKIDRLTKNQAFLSGMKEIGKKEVDHL